ncbi:MAG: FprA family A-type flavoprotein [Bacteroidales bacterium]|nr:FprA family A-type flavoprotein [Bacteroidales bacterium]
MKLSEKIRYVGLNDTTTKLFEHQWTIPYGVSYNSYLIVDEKIALIDTAAAACREEFLEKIKDEIGTRPIDYLIVNHMEPDHSALQQAIREKYPDCEIVTNAKAVPMIEGFQGIKDNIKVIKEGETLALGETTLQFFMVPMVHWPETMVTWCPEEKTLFSGDAFGTFKVAPECVIDSKSDIFDEYESEMRRYYSSIVGKYGGPVQTALKKLSGLEISRICSTHGPVWENSIPQVLEMYDRLSASRLEKGVCLVYGSMYGNTAKAAEAIRAQLTAMNIPVQIHDLCEEDLSFALADVFKYDSLIVGSPTYNAGLFPPVSAFMEALKARGVKNRKFAAFGSYSWAGTSVKILNNLAAEMQFETVHDGISFAQGFAPEKFAADQIAQSFA